MPHQGSCDRCNNDIPKGGGYAFYSSANIDGMVTGNMLFCEDCANLVINETEFAKPLSELRQLSNEELQTAIIENPNYLNDLNNAAIVQACHRHGLTLAEAKSKAHQLAVDWWNDGPDAAAQIAKFWMGVQKQTSEPTLQTPLETAISDYGRSVIAKLVDDYGLVAEGNHRFPFEVIERSEELKQHKEEAALIAATTYYCSLNESEDWTEAADVISRLASVAKIDFDSGKIRMRYMSSCMSVFTEAYDKGEELKKFIALILSIDAASEAKVVPKADLEKLFAQIPADIVNTYDVKKVGLVSGVLEGFSRRETDEDVDLITLSFKCPHIPIREIALRSLASMSNPKARKAIEKRAGFFSFATLEEKALGAQLLK